MSKPISNNSNVVAQYQINVQNANTVNTANNNGENQTDNTANNNPQLRKLTDTFQPTEVTIVLTEKDEIVENDNDNEADLKPLPQNVRNNNNREIEEQLQEIDDLFGEDDALYDLETGDRIVEQPQLQKTSRQSGSGGIEDEFGDDDIDDSFEDDLRKVKDEQIPSGHFDILFPVGKDNTDKTPSKPRSQTEFDREIENEVNREIEQSKSKKVGTDGMEVIAIRMEGSKSMKGVEVATTNPQKTVAPQDDTAKELNKTNGLVKAFKNFFTWIGSLFSKKESDPVVAEGKKELGTIAKNLDKIEKKQINETAEKLITSNTRGGSAGSGNLMGFATGETSLTTGRKTDGAPQTTFTDKEKLLRMNVMSSYIDIHIQHYKEKEKSSEKHEGFPMWAKDFYTGVEDAFRKNPQESSTIISTLKLALAHNASENKAERKVLTQILDHLEKHYTQPKDVADYSLKEFHARLPEQMKSPGAFFRGNTAAPSGAVHLLKLETPNFSTTVRTAMMNAINDVVRDFKQQNPNIDMNALSGQQVSELGILAAKKFIDNLFGATKGQQEKFAENNLGPETRRFIRETADAISNAPNTSQAVKNDIGRKWNSNNLILRAPADVMTKLKADFISNGETGMAKITTRLMDVVANAMADVTSKGEGKDKADREFLRMPGYQGIRQSLPGVLDNLISGC